MRLPEVLWALRSGGYRQVYLAGLVSLTGDMAHSVAESWLMLELTGSALAVGLVASLFSAPMTVFMLFGGVMADAFDRRRILVTVFVLRIAMVGWVAVLTFLGLVQPWHIYLLALGMGTTLAFSIPAFQSLIPLLVPKEAVRSAYALHGTSLNGASALGRSVGGMMVATLGIAWTFAFNAVTYIAPLINYLTIPLPQQQTRGLTWRGTWSDLGEGLRFLSERREALAAVVIVGGTMSVTMALVLQAPVFVAQALGEGPASVGFLMASWSLGLVVGSLASGPVGHRFHPLRFMTVASLLASGAVAAYGLAPNLGLGIGACFAMGALIGGTLVAQSAYLAQDTPPHLMGRIMAVGVFAQLGPMPVTSLLAGLFAEVVGIRWVIVGAAAMLGLGLLAVLNLTPRPPSLVGHRG